MSARRYATLKPPPPPGDPATRGHLDMLARPLELDRVPAALSMEGCGPTVGAIELRPRLHPMGTDALWDCQCLRSCRRARPVYFGRGQRIA